MKYLTRLKISNSIHNKLAKKNDNKFKKTNHDLVNDGFKNNYIIKSSYHNLIINLQNENKRILKLSERQKIYSHVNENLGFGYDKNEINKIINK